MAAHSPVAAVSVPVAASDHQSNWLTWLEHIALAVNQLMAWTNQPRLVAQTVATLPVPAIPGMLAYVTDWGGTTPALIFYNGSAWVVAAT